MSILRQFFCGDLKYPWERGTFPKCDRQKELIHQIDAETKYFTDKMTPEDKERFAELKKIHDELDGIDEADLFSYSFSLGFTWAMDIMREAEKFMEKENEEET